MVGFSGARVRHLTMVLISAATLVSCAPAADMPPPETAISRACQGLEHKGDAYTVCTFRVAEVDLRMFHSDADGVPFKQFDTLARELDETGKTLVFAMNGGMYHEDRRPVGFYRDQYGDQASVNTNDGPGNFHLKPNGVFWLSRDQAGVTESQAFIDVEMDPRYATQSGPMLVIEGALHPGLNPDGTSHRRRNGVGVSDDGTIVHFAISDTAVTFHDFATLFRDALGATDALFLDGQVSRIYAPDINRYEIGTDMGPMVGVVE